MKFCKQNEKILIAIHCKSGFIDPLYTFEQTAWHSVNHLILLLAKTSTKETKTLYTAVSSPQLEDFFASSTDHIFSAMPFIVLTSYFTGVAIIYFWKVIIINQQIANSTSSSSVYCLTINSDYD
jgi:hypothetical protein